MNANYATVDSSNRIVYAPDTLGSSLETPSGLRYRNEGYWPVDRTVPEAPPGQYVKPVVAGGREIGDLVTIQEEHIPETDENGEPVDPSDEYKPLLKVVRRRYEFVDKPVRMPTVADYNRVVENHLKSERIARGYDTREPSLYVNSSILRWRQDAQDWIAHVDAVMSYALSVLNDWKSGGNPPSLREFAESLPKIKWTVED